MNDMKTLKLTLNRKWFDMIKKKIKPEEYREIKDYWVSRLMENLEEFNPGFVGTNVASIFHYAKGLTGSRSKAIEYMLQNGITYKNFNNVSANNGYAKNCPNVEWEHKNIRVGEGNPEWGAEPGKQYFILSIGEITN